MSDARSQQVSPATSLPLQRATDAEAALSAHGGATGAPASSTPRPAEGGSVPRETSSARGQRRARTHRGGHAQRPRQQTAPPHATAQAPLLAGRALVILTLLATMSLALLDRAWTGRLSQFFDLSFVLVCIVAALAVRRTGLFTVGVLPPLVLAAVIAVLAAVDPATLTAQHVGFVSTLLTGLAHHAAALVAGHGAALAILIGRGTVATEP